MRGRYVDLRIMAPTAGLGITSDANIGVMVRLNNSNPRRMFGGVRTLSARIFARLRKGAQNFVAQKLARCGSAMFARFPQGKLDGTHEFKLNPLLDSCQCSASRKTHGPPHTAIPVGCHHAVALTRSGASPSGRALGAFAPGVAQPIMASLITSQSRLRPVG